MGREGRCWLCHRKSKELTEHHIIPKVLRAVIHNVEKHKVWICWPCHKQVHKLLPLYFADGSYRWKIGKRLHEITPRWEEVTAEERVLLEDD